MTLTIELTPAEDCLPAAARQEGIEAADVARKLVTRHLPAITSRGGGGDPTLDLFARWDEEDAHMTPDEIESEQRLWEQFESGVNEARRAMGMRQL